MKGVFNQPKLLVAFSELNIVKTIVTVTMSKLKKPIILSLVTTYRPITRASTVTFLSRQQHAWNLEHIRDKSQSESVLTEQLCCVNSSDEITSS